VIAVVVALLLLASPSLVIASAGGRADAGRASSSRGGPVARAASNGVAESTLLLAEDLLKATRGNTHILESLKANALSVAVGGGVVEGVVTAGLGWLLDQYGLGGGIEDQIAGIQTQLNEIQNTLNKVYEATKQLRTDLADSDFANLAAQATPIVSNVDTGMKQLHSIAQRPVDDPEKKELTEHLLTFIQNHLLDGPQEELDHRLRGLAGADGLITTAYKDALAHHRLWTLKTSLEVRAIVAYYETAETRLLMLRVEWMHAHHRSAAYIEGQINDVERMITEQKTLLKSDPGPAVIADTQTDLEWFGPGLSKEVTFHDAQKIAADVGSTGLWTVPKVSEGPLGTHVITGFEQFEVGKGWRLPQAAEVTNLIAGWSDPSGNWVNWLHGETDGQWTGAPHGVWTANTTPEALGIVYALAVDTNGQLALNQITSGTSLEGVGTPMPRSPFLVRTQPHHYW
jgi:hypothetical protein